MEELLGPIAVAPTLFAKWYFLLTCTIPGKRQPPPPATPPPIVNGHNGTPKPTDSRTPFFKDHLRKQIEAAGGTVYEHFEDVPKGKYRYVKLVAAHPCATAKYVQCMAADIKVECAAVATPCTFSLTFPSRQAVSHEYIIECCRRQTRVDVRRYILPTGWSLLGQRYVRWMNGRAVDQRRTATPFHGTTVLVASDSPDFVTFWSRVCRMAQANVRTVSTTGDISATTRGFMLTDAEFSGAVKAKAEHFQIAVVSTVWIVECLVTGDLCAADANEKFRKAYQDDSY